MPVTDPLAGTQNDLLAAARRWLSPVRAALGADFLAAYVTGGALTRAYVPAQARVNLLVLASQLDPASLDGLAAALPAPRKPPHFEPIFMTRDQVVQSLDVFPIEWLDVFDRHLLVDGRDVLAGLDVPRANLRLQCEHELRGKHLRLRQEYLASARKPERLGEVLARLASGFQALFRTLLRLRGETPPTDADEVVARVAALYELDPSALKGAHELRYAQGKPGAMETQARYRAFLMEIERLVGRIDGLRVP